MKNRRILKELEDIRKKERGLLRPSSVVRFARNPDTALHGHFQWDNNKAAHQYRLWQARQLISVCVIYEPELEREIPVYISLSVDRKTEGYRSLVEVLHDAAGRQLLLADALKDLAVFQLKYQELKELAGIFQEIGKLHKKVARRKH